MKKEDITGTIVYLLILGFGAVFVFTVLKSHAGASGLGSMYFLFNLGALVVGVIFNAILFELAHIAGAKIGRYTIVQIAILGVTFVKIDGKWKVSFSGFDGLTGETKIVPNENTEKESNPYPYLLFGSLFYTIELVIIILFFSIFKNGGNATDAVTKTALGNVSYFLLTVAAVGGMIFIYNILPFQLDTMTDGFKLTKVTNPKNREAFNELLRVRHQLFLGKEIDVKVFSEITNYTADLNLNKVYALLEKEDYSKAEEILDGIIKAKENISEKVYIRAKAQKVYIHLQLGDLQSAADYYDKEVPTSERREIADDYSMPCIRAYILMSGLLDKSRSECIIAINKVGASLKRTSANRKEIEKKLYNNALKKVHDNHPKWELDQYLLK